MLTFNVMQMRADLARVAGHIKAAPGGGAAGNDHSKHELSSQVAKIGLETTD